VYLILYVGGSGGKKAKFAPTRCELQPEAHHRHAITEERAQPRSDMSSLARRSLSRAAEPYSSAHAIHSPYPSPLSPQRSCLGQDGQQRLVGGRTVGV
jgi:hypothetical protein